MEVDAQLRSHPDRIEARGVRGRLVMTTAESWRNPEPRGAYHLLIVGAGPAGLLAAENASRRGAKVALIERNLLGGTCLNTGCIPSKTLIRTSRLYREMRDAEHFGGRVPGGIAVDFPAAMERVKRIHARLAERTSAERLAAMGIDVYFGEARFAGPDSVTVGANVLRFKKALVATGARPVHPPIPGLEEAGYLTYENVFDLTACPKRLLVIGGGPVGCELAQAFARLGSRVTMVQAEPMFLGHEERDAAQLLSDALARDGIEIHLDTDTTRVRVEGNDKVADLVSSDAKRTVAVDQIFVGVGTIPNVHGLELEAAGVAYDGAGGIRVDDFLRTSNPRIFAAGDVCTGNKFPHIESAAARIVVANALFFGRQRLSAEAIPWCTFTDPEIAHVGMYVTEARKKNIPVKTFTVLMHEVDRAIADGEEEGFVKLHVREGTGKILGATVVASHAGDLINEISLAMSAGLDLYALARVNQPYPTQSQAVKMAAGAYVQSRRNSVRAWLMNKWLRW
jgi:pyruvate/2-oxoglutarate dehydrogenase complex dihydrolipoamide dehydrogenase (E3) component